MVHWPGIRRIFRLEHNNVSGGVDDELQFHFGMKVEALMRQGLSRQDARASAERQFGDVDATRQQLAAIDRGSDRRARLGEWFGNHAQDLRYAARTLWKQPGFAAAVIITLGLGIGANVTMFGVVDRLLFRPPPYLPRPSEVNRVYLASVFGGTERVAASFAYPRYQDLTRWTSTLAQTAAVFDNNLAVGVGGDVSQLPVEEVSASFWSLFSARPVAGRFFTADEDRAPTGTPVAVLGYGYWQSAYAGAPGAIGKALQIGQTSYTIIGVAPRGFMGVATEAPAAFLPITAAARELGVGEQYNQGYGINWMSMIVRRKPGVTTQQATADLTNAYRRSYGVQSTLQRGTTPIDVARPRALAAPLLLERGPNESSNSKVATWLIAVAAIVLIIACANVGNLLLARALTRRREIAVRLALGISRTRLMRQLLTESLLLAAMGGVVGLCVAHWGGAGIRRSLLPGADPVSTWTDVRLLLFTMLAALAAGAIAGIVPAIQATRADIASALKAGVREGNQTRSAIRTSLLVIQASLSLVLLIGAGLFVQSLQHANTTRLGYDADRMLWVSIRLRGTKLSDTETQQLKWRLVTQAQALPEVEVAARIFSVPFQVSFGNDLFVAGIDSVNTLGSFQGQYISAGYFRTAGTAIVRGRALTEAEANDSVARAMVISQSMAKVLWPRADALGQCIRIRADTMPCTTVVGVAEDIKTTSLGTDPGLLYYLPIGTASEGGVFIRTRGDAARHAASIQRALQRTMPGAAYVTIRPFADVIHTQTRSWRLGATMFTIFGGLALLVAALGLYSVIAYGVVQRRHELGIRMALGAQRSNVLQLVLGRALRAVIVAVLIGVAVALVAARWLQPLLFGVSPRDPATLLGCSAIMLFIAAAASLIPALRAMRADPNRALRGD